MFESLIDPTHFGTVRRYLSCPGSSITDVLFVRDERLLAAVAELLSDDQPTGSQRALFGRWIRDGQIKVGVNGSTCSLGDDAIYLVNVHAISDEAFCRVLFLPPYYLVHLSDGFVPSMSRDTRHVFRD